MSDLQQAKQLVLELQQAFDGAQDANLGETLGRYTAPDYHWRGLHPFGELHGADKVVRIFWLPLRAAFGPLQRRQDIFLAGFNGAEGQSDEKSVWVCSMGHLLGQSDRPWLDIPPTGKLTYFRYAEFHRVVAGKLVESAFFFDLLSIMKQAGHYPLPPETGQSFMYPGPRTHDGVLLDACAPEEGIETLALINRMVDDLSALNVSGNDRCPPELLAKSWTKDMLWYGPTGIGASYTIERYQKQHQYPFRENLKDKEFNGHICRTAEGNYGCFFGWPNLTNTATGGFLGMTGNAVRADMRVVDFYRRDGDRLAENWVFIDLPYYLLQQGLDVLSRMRDLLPAKD